MCSAMSEEENYTCRRPPRTRTRMHTHTHTHAHTTHATHAHTHAHTHTHTHTHTHHTQARTRTHTQTHSVTHTRRELTYTHAHARAPTMRKCTPSPFGAHKCTRNQRHPRRIVVVAGLGIGRKFKRCSEGARRANVCTRLGRFLPQKA